MKFVFSLLFAIPILRGAISGLNVRWRRDLADSVLGNIEPEPQKGRLYMRRPWGDFSPAAAARVNRSAPSGWQGSNLSAATAGIQRGARGPHSHSRFRWRDSSPRAWRRRGMRASYA